ncbi:cysteine protease ATG4B [Bacillus rossius redtenbacheri]|uniref:cysteine protease ATG4B n=1 Tax=Bacillus rossius redtenbacheri TaxID=93214 RepID=UPI002FDC9528
MDMMFEAYLTHESSHLEPDDIPFTRDPVWILGKKYNAIHDLEAIRRDIRSKLWFTYRRGFVPIGDTNHTTDKGWGCMLRCGQMVLAQALVQLHLGRKWTWHIETRNSAYLKILHMFEDRRGAPYSIHQIALMGASERKEVGQWFGPNTVLQVLKKLSVYDEWSSLVIHVALDNCVVMNEVKQLCKSQRLPLDPAYLQCTGQSLDSLQPGVWRPLLLVVPLRLGLSEINPIYMQGLKTCFMFEQSLGVIGGKPNHALYFIGCVGSEVVYLDPHTTQPAGLVEEKEQEHEKAVDATYHCQYASRMHILQMDPSVAVCFFCRTEKEFDELCRLIQERLVGPEKQPLFELSRDRPQQWSPVQEGAEEALGATACLPVDDVQRQFDDSDEDFEILG